MARLLDALRKAMETSGKTRYRIAKESGVAESQLSRLIRGEMGLSIATIERLAEHLGLEIIVRPKRRRKEK